MGLKRFLADAAEALTGARIVRPGRVGLVFEEEHLKLFFARFCVDCVFDVGANEGQYAELLRSRVGYRGPIVSFEPIPELAAGLRSKANRTDRWFVEEAALDSVERVRSFNVMESDQYSSLLSPLSGDIEFLKEGNSVKRTFEIKTSLLSSHFQKYKTALGFKRPYLKIDTQGNDLAVATGAGDCIREFVGLQSELSIRKLYEGSADFLNALEFYRAKGFALSAFVPNNAGHFPALIEIDCILYQPAVQS